MLEIFLVHNPMAAAAFMLILLISDYVLTYQGAKIYHQTANEFIIFEKSYELTPEFQEDINKFRKISPRFIAASFITILIVIFVGLAATRVLYLPDYLAFFYGVLFLRYFPILMRHARNINMFSTIHTQGGVHGQIKYDYWFSLNNSFMELVSFGILFFFTFLFSGSWFWLGGTAGSFGLALNHRNLSRKNRPPP